MAYVILAIIFCVTVLAGTSGFVFHMRPSLGRKPLPPPRHEEVMAEIDQLERELRMGKYEKTQAEFDAEVDQALHPPPPPVPEVERQPLNMPMFKDYDEYKAWMQARYPNWHG